jgi:EF hand
MGSRTQSCRGDRPKIAMGWNGLANRLERRRLKATVFLMSAALSAITPVSIEVDVSTSKSYSNDSARERRFTMTRRSLLVSAMGVAGVAGAQILSASGQQDKYSLVNENIKELLLLMDTDKNGRVSKQEWMNFMEAEFDRLDKDRNGELDVNELRHSGLSVRRSN